MKKKIIFIVVSVLLMICATIFMAIKVYNSSFKTFTKSGYILNSNFESSNNKNTKYYFDGDTNYKKNYQNEVLFKDVNGMETNVSEASFVHYNDDAISLLKKGVILNLDEINSKVPKYYNVFEGVILEKVNGTYFVDNLGKQLKFKNFIVKIDENKYMIVSDNIKLKLGDTKEVSISSYVEIDFIEGNVVRISNQEVTYQTISDEAVLLVGNNISLNLNTKYFQYDNENKMNLNSIIIDSDDNIDIKVPEKDLEDEKEDVNNNQSNNTGNGINNFGGEANGSNIFNNGTIGSLDNNEFSADDQHKEGVVPSANVTDLEVSSNKVEANIVINDPDSLITGKTLITIVENSTGNVVYTKEVESGIYNIDVYMETLSPDTSYNITVTSMYKKNDFNYTIDLINQVFLTQSLGINLDKYYYTDDTLSFKISIDDYSKVKSAEVSLYTTDNNKIDSTTYIAGTDNIITFNDLKPNTKYSVVVDNILYDNYIISDVEAIEQSVKTLKRKPLVGFPSFSKDLKKSAFNLKINGVTDFDNGIENYHYEIYKVENGDKSLVKTIDKNTLGTIDLEVDDVNIFRNKSYVYKFVVDFYDNEKYIEIESNYSDIMIMEGKNSPGIKWDEEKVTFESAKINIAINDPDATIDLNSNIIVQYTDSDGVTNYKTFNGILNIPFIANYLKADKEYKVNVLGRVSLDGINYVDNSTIGNFIFKTKKPSSFEATFSQDFSDPQHRFKINTLISALNDVDVSLETNTLSMMSFKLIEGKDKNGKVVKNITLVDDDLREYYSALSDRYINKEFVLDPAFFGLANNDFSSEYYTIEITDLYDYTRNEGIRAGNKIPISNNVFTFRINDSLPSIPVDPVNIERIRNKDAGDHYDKSLDPDTIVGIKVRAICDNSKMNLKSINYRVFDADTNVELEEYSYVDNIKSDGVINFVTFWLEEGTSYNTVDTKMCRGHKYYFTWDALFDLDHDGVGETSFPYEGSPLKDDEIISVPKQPAKLISYPSKSTDDSLTLKYIYSDVDNSLYDNGLYAYVSNNAYSLGNLVDAKTIYSSNDYNSVTLNNLSTGYLTINSKEALLKNSASITKTKYIHQYFDKSYTLNDLSYTVMLDVNRIIISINDYLNQKDKMDRIAGLKLTFTCDGESIVKDFVEIRNGLAIVDMIDLNSFIGKDVTVKVEAYYDSGIIGYDVDSDYFALQSIKNEYGGGEYYIVNDSASLINTSSAMGAIYSKKNTEKSIELTNKFNNKTVTINNTPGVDGFNYNYQTMVVKALNKSELIGDFSSTFKFDQIIPGISLRNDKDELEIVPGIRTVSIRGDFYGVGASSIQDSKIYVELFLTDEQGVELTGVDKYTFTVDQLTKSIELDNLKPKQNYAFQITALVSDGNGGYTEERLYDLDENDANMTYYFKTLSSVAISNISTTFEATSYDQKQILLEYDLDRIIGYDKIEYKLFKMNENSEFVEMQTTLEPSTIFDNHMKVPIPCNPGSEFEFDRQYKIVITPVVNVTINDVSQRIELDNPGEYVFNLSKLRTPHIGISSTISDGSDDNSLDFRVTVLDVDKVIIGQTYKINVVDSNGNDVTPDNYVDQEFNVSDVNKKFVVSGLESGMTYIFKVIYNVDSLNNIDSEEKITTHVSNALNKDAVYLGDVYTSTAINGENNVMLSFYNSYRLTTIDNVRYTVYNSDNGMSFDNELAFEPVLKETTDGTSYYVVSLPNTFTDSGIYYIQLQFFTDGITVGETTLEYSHTKKQ